MEPAVGAQHNLKGLKSATTTLSLQSLFDTQENTKPKTSAPKDATFKQLHILIKKHAPSSIRVGEVRFHNGKKYQKNHFFLFFRLFEL